MKIMTVFGTRPEAIKMCPLVLELKKHSDIKTIVCLTGQHREMLQQVMTVFDIKETYNLDIMRKHQSLTTISTDILEGIEKVLLKETPSIVLVHGDTTTSFATALACYYQKIPVGHIEAGLRTGNIYSPYPEEMNRILTGHIASYHFAPTEQNRSNLEHEGIKDRVFVTGNTVIDAFATTVRDDYYFSEPQLNELDYRNHKVIVVTAHRRENLGKPLENICNAIKKIVEQNHDAVIVYPVHLNPEVFEPVHNILGDNSRIILLNPIDVLDMHNLIARCYMVMTDSGGLQEEAPHFGKPVLVMRTETERPEAVEAGTVKVVGVDAEVIIKEATLLISNPKEYQKMAKAVNPYGDGHASERIVSILRSLNCNDRLECN